MMSALLLTLLAMLGYSSADYVLGKIPPAEFDLPELNGFYHPNAAEEASENHPRCAGFTFRGLLNSSNLFPDRKYNTLFFNYVHVIEGEKDYSNWVSYKSRRKYMEYPGVFAKSSVSIVSAKVEDLETICGADTCPGVVIDTKLNRIVEVIEDIDMNSFVEVEDTKTIINLHTDPENVRKTVEEVDLCCPEYNPEVDLIKMFKEDTVDTLPRISCDMSVEEFTRDYLWPRKPVMLTGCIDNWKATKEWTIKSLLTKYSLKNDTWKTDISLEHGFWNWLESDQNPYWDSLRKQIFDHITEEENSKPPSLPNMTHTNYDDILLHGNQIYDLMNLNVSVRIFERIGVAPRRNKSEEESTVKLRFLDDYEWPHAIPIDLYGPTFGGSDYQWLIMSQPKTGTHIHHDPELTDAWNALLYGHKYWVMLPNDVYAEQYECSHTCSHKFQDLYAGSWFTHVLPQLRRQSWYGKKVIETVQKPGEVIYIPHGIGHAVLNLDENLSVTENFFQVGAIDELAKYYAYDWNPFPFDTYDSAARVWKNLLFRDLKEQPDTRSFARKMLEQVKQTHLLATDLPLM